MDTLSLKYYQWYHTCIGIFILGIFILKKIVKNEHVYFFFPLRL
jgi:hypothetical protein